jgi:hypothetical protein
MIRQISYTGVVCKKGSRLSPRSSRGDVRASAQNRQANHGMGVCRQANRGYVMQGQTNYRGINPQDKRRTWLNQAITSDHTGMGSIVTFPHQQWQAVQV